MGDKAADPPTGAEEEGPLRERGLSELDAPRVLLPPAQEGTRTENPSLEKWREYQNGRWIAKKEKRRAGRMIAQLADEVLLDGLMAVKGLFLEPEDEFYNPDAAEPYSMASTKTKVAVEIYKQSQANMREGEATKRALAVVALSSTMSNMDWEKRAKSMDVVATPTDDAVDAEVEDAKTT